MLKFHLPGPAGMVGMVASSLRHKNGPREKKTWAASAGQEENIIVEPYYTFKSPSEPSFGPVQHLI